MKRSAATSPSDKSLESSTDKQPSLMEQWKEHYSNRDFTAKPYHLHRMGLLTYVYCLMGVPIICALCVLPAMDLSRAQWLALTAFSLFLIVENLLNFFACQRLHHEKDIVFCFHCNRANPLVTASDKAETKSSDGWRACLKCQRDSPPRSHHCKLCGECVLRRGHHCYFLCCCVGHHNQKHFLVLCVYCIVGLLVGCYFVAAGITDQYQHLWRCLLPVCLWQWAAGYCSLGSVFLTASLYLQLGCLGVACVYLFLETVLILRGQTFYELGRNMQRYNLGAVGNLRSSLGSRCLWWPLLLAYPFDLAQSSDGVQWAVTKHL